ncbi:MAG TPA: FAD-dependent oxidoreductase [Dissulfurispiraceae bacterium]|nr:FAD-dependent oxidoreductase [Dissulfurispiraceae bacterium]
MSETVYDVIIIGGGPAGLSAALYASRAKLKTIILDKSHTAGALAWASLIENYPGLEKPLSGKELRQLMLNQAVSFGTEYRDEMQVIGAMLDAEIKQVFTMEATFQGKTVIIATGSMGRKASIKGEEEFLGRGVSYCAICDAAFFKGKTVCVLGNSEEAAKEAGVLARFAETVYLISPTPKLKVEDDYPSLVLPNVKVLAGKTVTAIIGGDLVEKITMKSPEGESNVALDGVFVYLSGSKPIVDFLQGAVEMSEEGCIKTNSAMETNIAGVLAAGDVTCTEARQVIIAAAQGALASLAAEKHVFGRKKAKVDWHG